MLTKEGDTNAKHFKQMRCSFLCGG